MNRQKTAVYACISVIGTIKRQYANQELLRCCTNDAGIADLVYRPRTRQYTMGHDR